MAELRRVEDGFVGRRVGSWILETGKGKESGVESRFLQDERKLLKSIHYLSLVADWVTCPSIYVLRYASFPTPAWLGFIFCVPFLNFFQYLD